MDIRYEPVNVTFEQLPGTDWGPQNAILLPISPGPMRNYSDYIAAQSNSVGGDSKFLMFRLNRKGYHTNEYEVVAEYGEFETMADVLAKYQELDREQRDKNCNAVSGGGRWSLD